MESGKLNRKIEIQQHDIEDKDANEQLRKWKTIKRPWARIECIGNGRKQIEAGKETTSLNYEITIRYTKNIDTSMRVKYKNRIFSIDHIDNFKEMNTELHLFCIFQEEGVYINE